MASLTQAIMETEILRHLLPNRPAPKREPKVDPEPIKKTTRKNNYDSDKPGDSFIAEMTTLIKSAGIKAGQRVLIPESGNGWIYEILKSVLGYNLFSAVYIDAYTSNNDQLHNLISLTEINGFHSVFSTKSNWFHSPIPDHVFHVPILSHCMVDMIWPVFDVINESQRPVNYGVILPNGVIQANWKDRRLGLTDNQKGLSKCVYRSVGKGIGSIRSFRDSVHSPMFQSISFQAEKRDLK